MLVLAGLAVLITGYSIGETIAAYRNARQWRKQRIFDRITGR